MPQVVFTKNLQRYVTPSSTSASGSTVREVLDAVFAEHPQARAYVLDEQGALRKHVVIFIDGRQAQDRVRLSDAVNINSEIYVMQALSGGL